MFWVAVLYFAEGFPFGFINETLPVYFRFHGVSLKEIGLLSLIGLPWTFKFLWAPLVDVFFRRKAWITACQLLMGLGVLLIALGSGPATFNPFFWGLLVGLAVLSATQDIAIDAYSIEFLEPQELGQANGIRVMFYRIALIASGGLLVAWAGFAGWPGAMLSAAIIMVVSAIMTTRVPYQTKFSFSSPPLTPHPSPLLNAVWTPLQQFLVRPGFWAVMAFILIFKVGDYALAPMTKAFWVDRAFTPFQIGLVPGTVGVVSTILGALIGGKLTTNWGIFKALWILGLFQAVSNLVYAAAAVLPASNAMMYLAVIVEAFCGGLGTASFLAFLMSICEKSHAATQYALLSAFFGLGRSVAGAFSGFAATKFGYAPYFTMTFFLALPAFALLPWVKPWAAQEQKL